MFVVFIVVKIIAGIGARFCGFLMIYQVSKVAVKVGLTDQRVINVLRIFFLPCISIGLGNDVNITPFLETQVYVHNCYCT